MSINDAITRKRVIAYFQSMLAAKYVKDDRIPCRIEEGLFLGSIGAANNIDELKRLNITHILTVAKSLNPSYLNDFICKKIEEAYPAPKRYRLNLIEAFQVGVAAVAKFATWVCTGMRHQVDVELEPEHEAQAEAEEQAQAVAEEQEPPADEQHQPPPPPPPPPIQIIEEPNGLFNVAAVWEHLAEVPLPQPQFQLEEMHHAELYNIGRWGLPTELNHQPQHDWDAIIDELVFNPAGLEPYAEPQPQLQFVEMQQAELNDIGGWGPPAELNHEAQLDWEALDMLFSPAGLGLEPHAEPQPLKPHAESQPTIYDVHFINWVNNS